MQYLLSEDEYEQLKNQIEFEKHKSIHTIQKLCSLVCDSKPILFWNRTEPKIWGCILTKGGDNGSYHGYCDECPTQEYCPHEHKRWSK